MVHSLWFMWRRAWEPGTLGNIKYHNEKRFVRRVSCGCTWHGRCMKLLKTSRFVTSCPIHLPSIPLSPLLSPPSPLPVSWSHIFVPKSECQFKSICCTIQSNAEYRTKYLYANIVTENQQQLIYHATLVNFVQEMNNRWRLHKTSVNNSNHIFQSWKDTFQYIATNANW